jgi:hypothetical protein
MDTPQNPDFITTDGTNSHSTKLPNNGNQMAGYAALQQRGKQASRVADARKKFLAYILFICGAAKLFLRLAVARTLNF